MILRKKTESKKENQKENKIDKDIARLQAMQANAPKPKPVEVVEKKKRKSVAFIPHEAAYIAAFNEDKTVDESQSKESKKRKSYKELLKTLWNKMWDSITSTEPKKPRAYAIMFMLFFPIVWIVMFCFTCIGYGNSPEFDAVCVKILTAMIFIYPVGIVVLSYSDDADIVLYNQKLREKREIEHSKFEPHFFTHICDSDLLDENIKFFNRPKITQKSNQKQTENSKITLVLNEKEYYNNVIQQWREITFEDKTKYFNEDFRAVYMTFDEYQNIIYAELNNINSKIQDYCREAFRCDTYNFRDEGYKFENINSYLLGRRSMYDYEVNLYRINSKLELTDYRQLLDGIPIYNRCSGFEKITSYDKPLSTEIQSYIEYNASRCL